MSDVFTAAALRLSQALIRNNFPFIDPKRLGDSLARNFESYEFSFAESLMHPERSRAWYVLRAGDGAGPLQRYYDELMVSNGLDDAIAHIIHCVDQYRVYPDTIVVDGDHLVLSGSGGIILRVEPIQFSDVDGAGRRRAENAMKDLRRYGDHGKAIKRLATLPGLRNTISRNLHDQDPRGGHLVGLTSNLSNGIRRVLKADFNILVPQHQALELAAAAFGAPSWHHLVANAEKPVCWIRPSVVAKHDGDEAAFFDHRFYRASAEALWAFSEMLRTMPDAEVQFSGSFIGDGPYLTSPGYVSYIPDAVADGVEENLTLAKSITKDGLAGVPALLADILGLKLTYDEQLHGSDLRTGSPRVLTLGAFRFSVENLPSTGNDYLRIESVGADGRLVPGSAVSTAIYKGSIGRAASGKGFAVLGDYDRDEVAVLTGLEPDDIQDLAAFAGLTVHNHIAA
ncbi:MAG TPA: hypothetical protein VF450_17455 [Noviherbaspirillum sp.]